MTNETLYIGRSDVSDHISIVGQHGALCEVKWWKDLSRYSNTSA